MGKPCCTALYIGDELLLKHYLIDLILSLSVTG